MTTHPGLPERVTPAQLLEALKALGITDSNRIVRTQLEYNAVTVHWYDEEGASHSNVILVRPAAAFNSEDGMAGWEKELLNPVVEDDALNKKKPIKIKRPR